MTSAWMLIGDTGIFKKKKKKKKKKNIIIIVIIKEVRKVVDIYSTQGPRFES